MKRRASWQDPPKTVKRSLFAVEKRDQQSTTNSRNEHTEQPVDLTAASPGVDANGGSDATTLRTRRFPAGMTTMYAESTTNDGRVRSIPYRTHIMEHLRSGSVIVWYRSDAGQSLVQENDLTPALWERLKRTGMTVGQYYCRGDWLYPVKTVQSANTRLGWGKSQWPSEIFHPYDGLSLCMIRQNQLGQCKLYIGASGKFLRLYNDTSDMIPHGYWEIRGDRIFPSKDKYRFYRTHYQPCTSAMPSVVVKGMPEKVQTKATQSPMDAKDTVDKMQSRAVAVREHVGTNTDPEIPRPEYKDHGTQTSSRWISFLGKKIEDLFT